MQNRLQAECSPSFSRKSIPGKLRLQYQRHHPPANKTQRGGSRHRLRSAFSNQSQHVVSLGILSPRQASPGRSDITLLEVIVRGSNIVKNHRQRFCSTSKRSQKHDRKGIATVWLIAAMPLLIVLLCGLTEIAARWIVLEELRVAASAGALAGAESWGEGLDNAHERSMAHQTAKEFARANLVLGKQIQIDANDDRQAINNNAKLNGDILLGNIDGKRFQPFIENVQHRGCLVRATAEIPSFWRTFSSARFLTITAVAVYNEETGQAKLIVTSGIDD